MEERFLGGWEEISTDEKSDLRSRVWTDMKPMWETAFPSMVTTVSAFGILLMSQSFLGRLNEFDISAFALVQIALIRFIHGTLLGMSIETDHHMKGISLQWSWKADIVTATITLPFFIFATAFHRLLGEEENTTALDGKIYLSCIPFLYYFVFNLTIQMFFQAQNPNCKNMILVYLTTMSFVLHNLSSWFFVYKLEWGTVGSLAATNIASWASGIGQFLYVFGAWFPISTSGTSSTLATFDISTWHALGIWPIIKLSVSSGIMLCSDLLYNSNILVLLAEHMDDVTVASTSAFSICLNVCSWEFMICLVFLSCACVRVSNELAGGNANAATFSIKVILSISLLVGVLFSTLCLAIGQKISYFLTAEKEVVDAVSDLSILFAISILLNSVYPVFSGVAIGVGLQGSVAIVNICCYYVIGIPLGAVLAYVAHLQIKGLWVGGGQLAQSLVVICIIIIRKIDWQLKGGENVSENVKRSKDIQYHPYYACHAV